MCLLSNVKGKDRGAAGNGFVEGELTVELRNLIVTELGKLGVTPVVDADDSILAQTLNFFKNLTGNSSIVLDLHWNAAASTTATGTETLVPSDATEFEIKLAGDLSDTVADVLQILRRGQFKNRRGVKSEAESHHGRLGFMRLKGENVLMEICFITNKADMERYQAKKQLLAKMIAEKLADAAKK